MAVNSEIQNSRSISLHRQITFSMILALFMLRYLVTGYRLVSAVPPGWVIPVFDIGTYLLVAILLVRESQSLADYHINALALWMVILFKPIETIYLSAWAELNSPMAFPKAPGLCLWVIALGLLFYFRSRLFQKGAVHWRDLRWALLGGLAGFATVLVTSYPESFEVLPFDPSKVTVSSFLLSNNAIFRSLLSILYQIGYAAVSEEPVFRGFLWGFLRKSGWRDLWIWLFQAGLFTLAHLYYFKTAPILFWFSVPLGALVLGWLAWRSRSIATSMAAHGVMNGLSRLFAILVAILR